MKASGTSSFPPAPFSFVDALFATTFGFAVVPSHSCFGSLLGHLHRARLVRLLIAASKMDHDTYSALLGGATYLPMWATMLVLLWIDRK